MRRQQKRPCRLVLTNHAYTIPCFKWFVKHFLSVFEIKKNSIVKCNNFLLIFLYILSHHNKAVNIHSFVGSLL